MHTFFTIQKYYDGANNAICHQSLFHACLQIEKKNKVFLHPILKKKNIH